MILVDTSVWIRALAGQEPYASTASPLALAKAVVRHDLIYGELLVGDSGGRTKFLAEFSFMRRTATVPHDEAVLLAKHRKLHGRGLSWIDVHLLASALAYGHQLWSADVALADAAAELGVAYSPSNSK